MDQLQFGCHFDQEELHWQTQIMEEPAAANADSSKTEGNLKAIIFATDKPLPPQNTGVAINMVPSKRAHQTQEISHPFFYHTNQQFTFSTQPHATHTTTLSLFYSSMYCLYMFGTNALHDEILPLMVETLHVDDAEPRPVHVKNGVV